MANLNCPTQLVESDSRVPRCDLVKPLSESVFSEIIDIILHRHSTSLIRISHNYDARTQIRELVTVNAYVLLCFGIVSITIA